MKKSFLLFCLLLVVPLSIYGDPPVFAPLQKGIVFIDGMKILYWDPSKNQWVEYVIRDGDAIFRPVPSENCTIAKRASNGRNFCVIEEEGWRIKLAVRDAYGNPIKINERPQWIELDSKKLFVQDPEWKTGSAPRSSVVPEGKVTCPDPRPELEEKAIKTPVADNPPPPMLEFSSGSDEELRGMRRSRFCKWLRNKWNSVKAKFRFAKSNPPGARTWGDAFLERPVSSVTACSESSSMIDENFVLKGIDLYHLPPISEINNFQLYKTDIIWSVDGTKKNVGEWIQQVRNLPKEEREASMLSLREGDVLERDGVLLRFDKEFRLKIDLFDPVKYSNSYWKPYSRSLTDIAEREASIVAAREAIQIVSKGAVIATKLTDVALWAWLIWDIHNMVLDMLYDSDDQAIRELPIATPQLLRQLEDRKRRIEESLNDKVEIQKWRFKKLNNKYGIFYNPHERDLKMRVLLTDLPDGFQY